MKLHLFFFQLYASACLYFHLPGVIYRHVYYQDVAVSMQCVFVSYLFCFFLDSSPCYVVLSFTVFFNLDLLIWHDEATVSEDPVFLCSPCVTFGSGAALGIGCAYGSGGFFHKLLHGYS